MTGQHIEPDLKTASRMSFGRPFLSSPACAKRATAIYTRNHSPIQMNIKVRYRLAPYHIQRQNQRSPHQQLAWRR